MCRLLVLVFVIFEMESIVTNDDDHDTPHLSQSQIKFSPAWTYDDEKKWPGTKCKEGGKRQSPIDIRKSQVYIDFNKDFIKNGPLKFRGYERVQSLGLNNGHTVQFSTEGDVALRPILTGGPLKYEYRLEQLHFHWLSEHSIDGVKYPMELHFVHVRTDLPVSDALKKKDGLSIISVFCNVQADLEDYQREGTEEIMKYVPKLMETGNSVRNINLDMSKLLNPKTEDYYTYAGSLTSPKCNEVVIWIIFSTPIYMSDVQYRVFSKIGSGSHNFRSLQKINYHQVFTPPSAKNIHTPVVFVYIEKMVKVLGEFFRNITSFVTQKLR